MTKLVVPLVGVHFRPPARAIVESLPWGQVLILDPEPENPRDPYAVKVLVEPSAVGEASDEALRLRLPGQGWTLEDFRAQEEPMWLGYIAKSVAAGGKAPQGNVEALEVMQGSGWRVTLIFDPAGKPMVVIEEDEA